MMTTTVALFFIAIFIMLQLLLGLWLLYRGYMLILDHYGLASWKNIPAVVDAQLRSMAQYLTWRRVAIIFSIFVPGSIPVLLLIAGWRMLRQSDAGAVWRTSARRLKTAITAFGNIAL